MNLNSSVTELPGVGEVLAKKLSKLNIVSVYDLLHHIPSRYVDYSKISNFSDIKLNEPITVEGQLISLKNIFTKAGKVMQEGEVSNGEDKIAVVWFNQTYLLRTLKVGTNLALTGKVSFWGKKRALFAPQYEIIRDQVERLHSGRIVSIYPETAGLSSKWIRRLVNESLKALSNEDFLPDSLLKQNELLGVDESLRLIHQPQKDSEIEKARQRLAFNELLLHTISQVERKKKWSKNKASKKFKIDSEKVDIFLTSLPFELTNSQRKAIEDIQKDLSKGTPMNRLLEGDVGSGKTVVAAMAAYLAYLNETTTLIMAPTQLLAEQHFKSISNMYESHGIPVYLVTGRERLKKIDDLGVYVGTHALLNRKSKTKIGLVVVDEQHRFGVKQRANIIEKTHNSKLTPHTLTMTATPIPRTIALTLYGDLDISTLNELPSGRKKIKTWVVPQKKRKSAYTWIQDEILKNQSQAFVVCPLIDESDAETLKTVKVAKTEFENLRKVFKKLKVGLLHGKMKADEKNKILNEFRDKKYDILVTTPVVEVGIDIPNATIMMIESSDRFGLAALHQLRGRVGRGEKQSYCLLFTESKSEKVINKLEAMSKTMSGRDLAELDLSMRGPGEIFGTRQSGLPELKIARWTDIELIKKAKNTANEVFNNQEKYQDLINHYKSRQISAN